MTTDKNLGWTADEYSKLAGFDSDWRDSWWNQDYLELLATRLRFEHVQSVLDVGCGAGHWGQRVATLLTGDASVVGVDHEEGFLDAARTRAARRPQSFEYRVASGGELPFEDDTFDLVTCQTVLIHVADPRAVLTEMLRVTKAGGVLLVAEPNNLVNAMVHHVALPRAPFEETLALLAFEETCMRGKIALGQGDGCIGERLPQIFGELPLEDRRVSTGDRTGGLRPPYDTAAQRELISMMRSGVEAGHSRSGDLRTARELYAAGSGDAEAFDELWAMDQAAQRRTLDDIDGGRYVSAGGFLMFVVSGRKLAAG